MQLRGVPINRLEERHIQKLLEDQVSESRVLDYKLKLPRLSGSAGDAEKAKLAFVKDIASFANTAGGVILFGVECKESVSQPDTSIPSEIPGIEPANLDAFVQRVDDLMRASLDPPLHGLEVRDVPLECGQSVFAIGIAKSQRAPHAINMSIAQDGQVWRRGSRGNHRANMDEVTQMVLESHGTQSELVDFTRARFDILRDRPNLLSGEDVTLFHILPIGRLGASIDLRAHTDELARLGHYRCNAGDQYFNFDGYYVPSTSTYETHHVQSFTQWLR